jgi:Flp pilus assembly protein TadG
MQVQALETYQPIVVQTRQTAVEDRDNEDEFSQAFWKEQETGEGKGKGTRERGVASIFSHNDNCTPSDSHLPSFHTEYDNVIIPYKDPQSIDRACTTQSMCALQQVHFCRPFSWKRDIR